MFEKLDEPFRQLAPTVHSVEVWTAQMLELETLKPRDRELIKKLEKYTVLCRKNSKNWSNKTAAKQATKKLGNLWASLLLDVIMPQERKK